MYSIHSPEYVAALFNKMARTYRLSNYIASFGFSERWRRQCVAELPPLPPYATGYDLMSGMGESWRYILPKLNHGKIIAVDLSKEMNKQAFARKQRLKLDRVEMKQADILQNGLPAASADFIVSTFGIKTFDKRQAKCLAIEIERLLKPGGVFAFIEISEPKNWFFKGLYMFYINRAVPFIGRFLLGDPDSYQMLGQYCQSFKNCRQFMEYLQETGLKVEYKAYFYGCATGVKGQKIKQN